MRRLTLPAALLLSSVVLASAVAYHGAGNRYQIAPNGNYPVRLDTRTGRVEPCMPNDPDVVPDSAVVFVCGEGAYRHAENEAPSAASVRGSRIADAGYPWSLYHGALLYWHLGAALALAPVAARFARPGRRLAAAAVCSGGTLVLMPIAALPGAATALALVLALVVFGQSMLPTTART